jgi:hypothetical protein
MEDPLLAESGPPNLSGQTAPAVAGASVQPQYAKRVMKVYAINENEVTTITSLNTQATFFFSLASFLTSAAISIFTNAVFYTELTPAGVLAKEYVAPMLCVVSVALIIIGVTNLWRRRKLWNEIRRESQAL